MHNRRHLLPGLPVITLLTLSACLQASPKPTLDRNLIYTAGAETLAARVTDTPATVVLITITPPLSVITPTSTTPPPSATLTPSITPTSTATEPVVPTAPAEDPRLQLGPPDWEDQFEDGSNWPMIADEHAEMNLKDGELRMVAHNPDMWDSWMIAMPELEDFYLEMTARPAICEAKDHYGLLFRAPDVDSGYLLSFTCDGQYSLRTWDGEEFSDLIDWTPSDFIHKGPNQTNRLGVMVQGDQLALYANGNLITRIVDGTYSEGSFGLLVGSDQTEDFKTFVSDVAYWVIR